jgi:alkylation response protein AidB-like acyl-CoA dehydrogenase
MLAEMKMRVELCRSSISLLAAEEAAGGDTEDLGTALAYAVPQLARECVELAVQVHGGTGFTWEYGLHLYYRRVLQTQAGFGGAAAAAAAAGRDLIESRA